MKIVYIAILLLPIAAAGALLAAPGKKRANQLLIAASAAELILCAATAAAPKQSLALFSILDLKFTLAPDAIGCLFACLFGILFLAVAIFSGEYLEDDKRAGEFSIFYLITLDAMLGLSLAGDLATYYMFFECLTLFSFPLILHDRRDESRKAAWKYLSYSLLGAGMVLFGLVFANKILGNLDFAAKHIISEGAEGLALVTAFVTILGFGCKAGMMPFHLWLPIAHPEAPAPASAVLSGCLTKAGLLGILRVVYYMFGPNLLANTWVQYTLLIIALVTIFCGSMMAFRENLIKRRLAYSTVSQVSYALFGLFLMSSGGFTGAILQVIFHAATKVCLFLCAGAMIHHTGIDRLYNEKGEYQYYGIGKSMPWVMIGYTFASVSLVGLPAFGGFISKLQLALGSMDAFGLEAGWIGGAVLVISALLTAGYLLPISTKAFFPTKEDSPVICTRPTWRMSLPIMTLAIGLLVMGIFHFECMNLLGNIAGSLQL